MDISDIRRVLRCIAANLEHAAAVAPLETKAGLLVAVDQVEDVETRLINLGAHLTDSDLVLECALRPLTGADYDMLTAARNEFETRAKLVADQIDAGCKYDWSKLRHAAALAEKAATLNRAAYAARAKTESPA